MLLKNKINTEIEIIEPGKDSQKLTGFAWYILIEVLDNEGWTKTYREFLDGIIFYFQLE